MPTPTKAQLAAKAARNKLQRDLNKKIVANFAEYLNVVGLALNKPVAVDKLLRDAADDLTSSLTSTTESATKTALELAKQVKAADYAPLLKAAKVLLAGKEAQLVRLTELSSVSAIFGGGLDKKIVDSVWNKVWPDSLTVDKRIERLSTRVLEFTERTVKQGISEGLSARNIANQLKDHFETEGLEKKAAFRLAAHTTNMVYESANAAISIDAQFVKGIRIVRGMYGPMSETCEICDEHGGQDFKEYLKENGDDLAIMSDMPPYHSNCNCGVEDIVETAAEFIARARSEA